MGFDNAYINNANFRYYKEIFKKVAFVADKTTYEKIFKFTQVSFVGILLGQKHAKNYIISFVTLMV